MRTEDSQPNQKSIEDATEVHSSKSSSSTGLFLQRSSISTASDDEISLLLQSPDNGQANAAPSSDIASPIEPYRQQTESNIVQENPAQIKPADEPPAEKRSAGQEFAPVSSSKPRVDLTGIFRKIELEKIADAPFAERTTSTQLDGLARSAEAAGQVASIKIAGHSQVGFTEMFQSLSAASTHSSPTSRMDSKDKASSIDEKPDRSTWNENSQLRGESAEDSRSRNVSPSSPKGDFTSLFQGLGKEAAVTPEYEKLNPPSPTPQPKGGFTQLLRTLSATAEIKAPAYPIVPPPLPPQPSGGPGEFTRIISSSMLREAQGRVGAPMRTEAPQLSASTQNSAPAAPITNIPAPMPAFPQPPQHLLSPQPMPMQQSPLHIPALPVERGAVPAPSLPQNLPTQLQVPASKLQQYMPLLLIANLFLMLLVLTLVLMVLLARH